MKMWVTRLFLACVRTAYCAGSPYICSYIRSSGRSIACCLRSMHTVRYTDQASSRVRPCAMQRNATSPDHVLSSADPPTSLHVQPSIPKWDEAYSQPTWRDDQAHSGNLCTREVPICVRSFGSAPVNTPTKPLLSQRWPRTTWRMRAHKVRGICLSHELVTASACQGLGVGF